MTVQELIDVLDAFDKESEVQILIENDDCELCSHLKHERCSLSGEYHYDCLEVTHKPDVVTIEAF